jgi:hypothetical protein
MSLVGKSQNHQKCLRIERLARMTQSALKRIIVGRVLRVDVQIRLMLEIMANMYNHHHCLSRRSPGKIMAILVEKPHASTELTLVQ